MPSTCGRNAVVPALRSSAGLENCPFVFTSLIYKDWRALDACGQEGGWGYGDRELCLCCWTAVSSSQPRPGSEGKRRPWARRKPGFWDGDCNGTAQNQNVRDGEGWVWGKLLWLEAHLHLQPSPSTVRVRRAIGPHSCGSCPSEYQVTAWKSLLVCFPNRHLMCSCSLFPSVLGLSQGCDSPFLLGQALLHNCCVAICVLLLWEGSRWVPETAKLCRLWVELLSGGTSVCREIVRKNKWIFWQWRQMTAERSASVKSVSKEWVINVKTASRWLCLKFLSDVCRTSILVDCAHSGPRALGQHWGCVGPVLGASAQTCAGLMHQELVQINSISAQCSCLILYGILIEKLYLINVLPPLSFV